MSRPARRTLTAPNGAKVRTAKSQRYVAVRWGYYDWADGRREHYARVYSGSDTYTTLARRVHALQASGRLSSTEAVSVYDMLTGQPAGGAL